VTTRAGFPQTGRYVLALVASVSAGVLVAVQSRINGEFGVALGNGALAALISFSVGLAVVSLAMAVSPTGRQGVGALRQALRAGDIRWWGVLGGVGGAFLVLTQGLTAGILGVALFSIAVVTGQSLGALVIDSRGWFGAVKVALRPRRALGALIVVLGVVLALDVTPGELPSTSAVIVLPLLAGLGTGFQQAVNGRVKVAAGSALTATFVNFTVGTATLAVVTLALWPVIGPGDVDQTSWWLWTGGVIGALFIAIQVTTVGIIGVLGLGVSLVSGQLVGSLLLDLFAPVATTDIGVATVAGLVVTLAGAVLVTLGSAPAKPST
jgi:bacterial/archaeal transporter family-2 protein